MLNLILILALAGVLVISAGFAGVTFMQGVQSSLDAEITNARLLDVATQITTYIRTIDATGTNSTPLFALPQGAVGSSPYAYNQVPSFITSSASSASGIPFEYCPYDFYSTVASGGTPDTVTMASGNTYNIYNYNAASTGSQNYLAASNTFGGTGTYLPQHWTGSFQHDQGSSQTGVTLGFLIAPAPNQYYPPDCSSITQDTTGAYALAPGGIVKVIAPDYLNRMKVPTAMTDFRFYVSLNPSGDGSGRDTSNYITLQDALTIIQNLKPASAMIYVNGPSSPTNYSITTTNATGASETNGTGSSLSWGTRIYLEGINGNGAVINTSSNITIDAYSMLSIGNLTLNINSGAGTITVNGTLEMSDSSPKLTAGSVQIYGGSIKGYSNIANNYISTMTINGLVTVDGGGTISSSGPMIFNNLVNRGFALINGHVYGGTTMQFNTGTSGIVPIIIKAGGDLIAGSDTMTINSGGIANIAGGMVVDPGGRFFGAVNSAYRVNMAGNPYGSSVIVNNASNYGFYVHGEMDLVPWSGANGPVIGTVATAVDYPNGAPTYGIVLASGGKFQLEASTNASPSITGVSIGTSANRPTVGILDFGGGGFFTMIPPGQTGGTNIIYANVAAGSCWASSGAANTNIANLFSDSQSAQTNGNSASTQTVTFPNGWYRMYNDSANLTCQRT